MSKQSSMIGDQSRVLVTGGASFIGRRLVDYLVAAGAHATVIDDLIYGASGSPPGNAAPD